jgi:hypothetical protein
MGSPLSKQSVALLVGLATGIAGVGRGVAASAPARAVCAPAALVVTVATDHRSYRRGQPVTITVTVRNGGKSACAMPTGSCLPQVLITGRNGKIVWNRAETQVVCVYGRSRALRPGRATSRVVSWDGILCAGRTPKSCPGGPAPPGTYRALATWSSFRRGSAAFVVRS